MVIGLESFETVKSKTNIIDQNKELQKELAKLSKGLDETGLKFLIKQAGALIHNQKVVELNKEKIKSAKKQASKTVGKKPGDTPLVKIDEADDYSNFIVVANNYRNFFALDEFLECILAHL